MTVIVKITSGENKADENVSKGFELIPIAAGMRASFIRDEDGKGWLNVRGEDSHGEERLMMNLPVLGNAYIMDDGKTVASFSSANIPDRSPYPRGQTPGFTTIDESPILPDTHGDTPVKEVGLSSQSNSNDHLSGYASTEQYPDDITDINDARLLNVDRSRVDDTYKTICMIMASEESFSDKSDEHFFAMGLAIAIDCHRRSKLKHCPTISLCFTGSVVCPRNKLNKLENYFRLAECPVSLRIDSNDGDYITEYRVAGYYNRHDVDEAEMLLLRELRNNQKGLVKNMIDKIIKYYKAGVSVVPLEPATEITLGARRQITAKLNEVLTHARFNLISADSDEKVYGVNGPCDENGAAFYTHVVIKFLH